MSGQGSLVHNSGSGWFEWLKRLLGFGKQTVSREEDVQPVSTNPPGGTLYSADAAVREFGESFIGVVEIGSHAPRVTAGSYAKNINHLTLSKQNFGSLQAGQRRFGFMRNRGGITIGPSSTGAIPTVDEIAAIRSAFQQQGYLTLRGLHLIVAEDTASEQHLYNLLTGEVIQ